ncbi:MAG: UPF0149 family protein [Pseudomonadota bacterium]
MSSAPPFDYDAYVTLFEGLALELTPAECHGGLTGLLCATDTVGAEQWIAELMAGKPTIMLADDGVAGADDDTPTLRRLYEITTDRLEDPDYGFTLLLPADAHPLAERTETLSQWCQGFLWGLGLGGIQDEAKLPGDVNEVMRDMSEISRLRFADQGGGNEDETAYAEIIEYVRMAALLVYEELRPLRVARPDGNAVH